MKTLLQKKHKLEDERAAEKKAAREEERPVYYPTLNSKEYQQEITIITKEIVGNLNVPPLTLPGYYVYAKCVDKILRTQTGKKQRNEINAAIEKYGKPPWDKEILKKILRKIKSSPYLKGPIN